MGNLKEPEGSNVKNEVSLSQKVKSEVQQQNGENSSNSTNSSGSGSDSDNNAASNITKTTSSVSSSCSSVASSGTTSKLALRMADQVSLSSSPAEKRFKFEPNEDYLDQLLAMGISLNGAKKALYYTGNRSVNAATNWIFDHPELDLETPLEEEIKRLQAEELEEDCLEEEEDEEDSEEEAMMAMHYRQHHQRQQHLQSLAIKRSLDSQSNGSGAHGVGGARGVSSGVSGLHHGGHDHHDCVNGECDDEDEDLDEEEIDEEDEEHMMNGSMNGHHSHKELYYDVSDETDSDSDDFDQDDIPEFKMVFVVNTSLDMGPGKTAAQVGHAALGVQRVLTIKSNKPGQMGQNKYKVSTTDLGLWQDFGEKMVVVKGESTQHLKDLHLMAEDLDLPSFLVKDAGITQVPSGSVTVFGVFGEDEDVNKITGRLKLL